ncbi:hypothetical protein EB001_24920 [bacterium]|nr:hypothetical protein [bacterium]
MKKMAIDIVKVDYDRILDKRIDESIKARQKGGLWRLWAKALGEKASQCDRESDKVAVIRTIVVGVNFITCLFIIAGIIRHW